MAARFYTGRRVITTPKGTIFSTDYAPAKCDVFTVIDPRLQCPRCHKYPAGCSARSKKRARRGLDRFLAKTWRQHLRAGVC